MPQATVRRIAVVQSAVNVRRLTPGLSPFAALGYDFWIIDIYRRPDLLLEALRAWCPSAILAEWVPGVTERLVDLGVPLILVPADAPVPGAMGVDVDDEAIGRAAAEHLKQCGYRHFAFVGRRDAHYADQRLAGFRSVVGEVPVFREEFRHWRQYDEYWREPEEDLVDWLAAQPLPLGVFAAHDPTGRHVLEAAASAGRDVPFALGVISANDDDTVSAMARPALSSIGIPWRRLAAEAVRAAEQAWAGAPLTSPILAPPLPAVARGSTSYEAVDDPVVRQALRLLRARAHLPLTVEQLAAASGVSRRVLERRFRAAVGHAPYALINRERIERAKALLSGTDMPVALIAERCGFMSHERFTVNFRQLCGLTPAAYRKRAGSDSGSR